MFLAVIDLVEAVSQRGCGRFVDDAEHVEARDLAGVFRGLALAVGEVRRAGDDRFGDRFAQVRFRVGFQFLQDHRGDFLRGIALAVDIDFVITAHVALDGYDGAVRIGHGLALRELAHEAFARLGEAHHGRGQAGAFRVRDDDGFAAFHDCHDGVRRTKIDTNDFRHRNSLLQNCFL